MIVHWCLSCGEPIKTAGVPKPGDVFGCGNLECGAVHHVVNGGLALEGVDVRRAISGAFDLGLRRGKEIEARKHALAAEQADATEQTAPLRLRVSNFEGDIEIDTATGRVTFTAATGDAKEGEA